MLTSSIIKCISTYSGKKKANLHKGEICKVLYIIYIIRKMYYDSCVFKFPRPLPRNRGSENHHLFSFLYTKFTHIVLKPSEIGPKNESMCIGWIKVGLKCLGPRCLWVKMSQKVVLKCPTFRTETSLDRNICGPKCLTFTWNERVGNQFISILRPLVAADFKRFQGEQTSSCWHQQLTNFG